MSDLIEHLRQAIRAPSGFIKTDSVVLDHTEELMNQAADEIERLRADLKEARQAARECWRLIYESGENPISDTDCAALSEDRLWLEQR